MSDAAAAAGPAAPEPTQPVRVDPAPPVLTPPAPAAPDAVAVDPAAVDPAPVAPVGSAVGALGRGPVDTDEDPAPPDGAAGPDGDAGGAGDAGGLGGAGGDPGAGDPGAGLEPALPEGARARVLALAAAALGRMAPEEVPAPLRAAARFTPAKRIRLAGSALAAVLATDAAFRLRAAGDLDPAAADALRTGLLPAAADPVELAAAAYLLRTDSWTDVLERTRAALAEAATRTRDHARDGELERLRAEVAAARAGERGQAQRARAAADAARAEADDLRRQLREQTGLRRQAERSRTAAEEALAEERRRAATEDSRAQAELRRLRQRLAEAEDAVETGRRAARETRQADEARLWLLLDTAAGAVQGLRRELALTPTEERPADSVAAALPAVDVVGARGDDPELVDRLLELPHVHLVVDGYNVTKSGYGELPLAAQRSRLIRGLGALAARTGAEVTCVFDGATRPPVMPPGPRGVRVLFSKEDEIADDVIRRLVGAEPTGRPVVVVSSDREVADDITRAGAYAVASALLLRRLDRG